jgi:hypothetical protein
VSGNAVADLVEAIVVFHIVIGRVLLFPTIYKVARYL